MESAMKQYIKFRPKPAYLSILEYNTWL